MRVFDRMSPNPSAVRPQHTFAAAKALMDAEGLRHVTVVEDGNLVGILSERDLRNHWGYLDRTSVDVAMTRNPITIPPAAHVADAARTLLYHRVGSLPVVSAGKVVGIITTTDFSRRCSMSPHSAT